MLDVNKPRTAPAAERSGAEAIAPGTVLARMSTTRANALAGLVADAGISVLLVVAGLTRLTSGPLSALLTVGCGLLLFSFVEYCFHRWLFHGAPGIAEAGHRKHHENPAGYDALPFFLPPLGMLGLGAALTLVLPTGIALLLAGALAAGYAAYGLAHSAIHVLRFRGPMALRWAANHHIHHHHPRCNFGVTTPLWDVVLGTRRVPATVPAGAPPRRRPR
jgi:sterol desaturase/sphingolipid hydroxylase (fatty acid hydroxylase superfamily)